MASSRNPTSAALSGTSSNAAPARPLACPCGGAAPNRPAGAPAPPFADCCGRYLDGGTAPPNALELMRSRYSAYVLGDAAWLRATWAPHTCPAALDVAPDAPGAPRWLGLQIRDFAELDADRAEVSFVARYKLGGKAHRLEERSRFTRGDDGRWRYVDGDVREN